MVSLLNQHYEHRKKSTKEQTLWETFDLKYMTEETEAEGDNFVQHSLPWRSKTRPHNMLTCTFNTPSESIKSNLWVNKTFGKYMYVLSSCIMIILQCEHFQQNTVCTHPVFVTFIHVVDACSFLAPRFFHDGVQQLHKAVNFCHYLLHRSESLWHCHATSVSCAPLGVLKSLEQ